MKYCTTETYDCTTSSSFVLVFTNAPDETLTTQSEQSVSAALTRVHLSLIFPNVTAYHPDYQRTSETTLEYFLEAHSELATFRFFFTTLCLIILNTTVRAK